MVQYKTDVTLSIPSSCRSELQKYLSNWLYHYLSLAHSVDVGIRIRSRSGVVVDHDIILTTLSE